MSVKLSEIIPWGRSAREYELMFDLTPADCGRKILGCGDGPASFNAEMTQRGRSVVSCDPIYHFSATQISERFEANIEPIISQVRAKPQNYVWSFHRDPDDLLSHRRAALEKFVGDFPAGLAQGRYVVAELPRLPFTDGTFGLALCSHLLFLYSNFLSLDFHIQSVMELCRVAGEVRIFPLTGLDCELSPHLEPLKEELTRRGLKVAIVPVNYQFQRNGDKMLRVMRA